MCTLLKVSLINILKLKFKNSTSRQPPVPVTHLSPVINPATGQNPQLPQRQRSKRLVPILLILLVLLFCLVLIRKNTQTAKAPTLNVNRSQYSVNDPSSIWVVVNKGRVLPSDFIPADLAVPNVALRLPSSDPEMQLRKTAATALEQMFSAANQQNVHLMLASGYRSYGEQVSVYSGFVGTQGVQSTDASSAKPGYSEHQLGLAADVEPTDRNCETDPCFAATPEGQWVAANSYKYGFIIRYPKDKQNLTGYEYEPWHLRFVGSALAMQLHGNGQTMEQFFGLPVYADYPANPYQLKIGQ